jgi:hypothetical protein
LEEFALLFVRIRWVKTLFGGASRGALLLVKKAVICHGVFDFDATIIRRLQIFNFIDASRILFLGRLKF